MYFVKHIIYTTIHGPYLVALAQDTNCL